MKISRIGVVLLTSLTVTLLLGLSRISLMVRMDSLGLYEFDPWMYVARIATLFLVCSIFLFANVFYNQIRLGPIRFNMMSLKGIVFFNLLLFIPVQVLYMFWTIHQVKLPVAERLPIQSGGGMLMWAVMTNIALMVISALVGAVYRFMRENYQIRLKNEVLQKESAEARFANLKEQLNPHFLFNSFSTLNGLIDEAPDKAKKFVHDMSDVYRYVLKNEKVDTVTLQEEMEFASIYLAMVKERFGEAIKDHIEVSEQAMGMKVIPLAIQMLIENAVKHNNFDHNNPLQLVIKSNDSYVEVKNSLRVRQVQNNHSLGLYNLNQRYTYLSKREVIITRTDDHFIVQIPLLQ